MTILAKYRLKKDLPDLKAGAIFEHRSYDSKYPDRGNLGCGTIILVIDKNSKWKWCKETYILPGQLAKNKEWFEKINNNKELIEKKIKKLQLKIDKLEDDLSLLED